MKKNLDYYMNLNYKMEIYKDDEGYALSFPDLPGCITCAETLDELMKEAIDAKETWLVFALENKIQIPEPKSIEEYPNEYKLRMPKSLYKSLADDAKMEGISMNQYCVYLLSQNRCLEKHKTMR